MKVFSGSPWEWPDPSRPRAVAIGVFDGVHHGHRYVIRTMVSRSVELDLEPAVLTFDPHPVAVIAPEQAPDLLTGIGVRVALFEELGVETVGVLSFDDDIRRLSPAEFVVDVVVGKLGARSVVVGEDFRFGNDRTGHVGLLRELGDTHGFEAVVVPLVGDERPVSSTAIRTALADGDLATAVDLLGHPPEVGGEVRPGDGRGSTIGVPTANLDVASNLVLPGRGVYAVRVRSDDEWVPGVANVGVRPTFGGDTEDVLEVHLLDWSGDLYGMEVSVRFVERIRDEMVFGSVEALVSQIRDDIETARGILTRGD